jgi:CheY-like chemotaxis protein
VGYRLKRFGTPADEFRNPLPVCGSCIEMTDKAPIDTLRLAARDRIKIVDAINKKKAGKPAPGAANRRGVRVDFNIGSVIKYSVAPRNISSRGLAFIHGQFVHPQSPCQVILPNRRHEWVKVEGLVVGCRHVAGLIHEVSVCFAEVIDLAQFVALTPEEEAAYRQERAAIERTSAARGKVASFNGLRVGQLSGEALIVDDYEADRQLYSLWLRKQGLTTLTASCGGEAKHALAAKGRFDVMLIDMHLGTESGLELIKSLREQGVVSPIIGASADDTDAAQATALAAGCNAFFSKPFDREEFLQSVEQLLSFSLDDPATSKEPITSSLADDPEMQPLLLKFVAELSKTTGQLEASCKTKDFTAAGRLCEQLKGAGGAFGLLPITRAARLALGQLHQTQPDVAAVERAVGELVAVARRVVAA